MSPQRWKAITPSQSAWESETLEYLRAGLPDHEPYMAWSNFELLADKGTVNALDALLLIPMGFSLIEIRSRPGIRPELRADCELVATIINDAHARSKRIYR